MNAGSKADAKDIVLDQSTSKSRLQVLVLARLLCALTGLIELSRLRHSWWELRVDLTMLYSVLEVKMEFACSEIQTKLEVRNQIMSEIKKQ